MATDLTRADNEHRATEDLEDDLVSPDHAAIEASESALAEDGSEWWTANRCPVSSLTVRPGRWLPGRSTGSVGES